MSTRVIDGYEGAGCDHCSTGHYYWRNYCGAYVCDKCEDHKGLCRCFCGWRQGHQTGYAFEAGDTPQTPEGEDSEYFGDEPVDEEGFYRD